MRVRDFTVVAALGVALTAGSACATKAADPAATPDRVQTGCGSAATGGGTGIAELRQAAARTGRDLRADARRTSSKRC